MSEQDPAQERAIRTVEGSTDMSKVEPHELVAVPFGSGDHKRDVLLPAGKVLTSDRTSLGDAPDGGTEMLDETWATKVDGKVVDTSVSNQDLNK